MSTVQDRPPAPEGWTVHADKNGDFFYITPKMKSSGQQHKITKNSHLRKYKFTIHIEPVST